MKLQLAESMQTAGDRNNMLYSKMFSRCCVGWACDCIYVHRWAAITIHPYELATSPAISVNLVYVHKTEVKGQDPISDSTTIQSDYCWTPRAPSYKQAWLGNPFSVIHTWRQITPFLTFVIIEGKLKRGHIFTSIQQSTHSCTFDPPVTLHTPQLDPR